MATAPFQLWVEMAPVASAVRVGSTVTITTSSAHGFTSNAYIQVEDVFGAAGTSMVGVHQITVTSGTAFTYNAAGAAGTGVVNAAAISYDLLNPLNNYAAGNRNNASYVILESVQMSATGDGSGASLTFTVAQDDTPADGPWYTLIPDEARVRLVKANTGTTPASDKSNLLFISSIRGITAMMNGSGQGTVANIDLVDPTAQLDRLVVYGNTFNAKFVATGGAVRSSNVVTITSTAKHGLVAGSIVMINGVTGGSGTSFNGRFTVASAPTTTTFTYAQLGDDATGNTAVTPTAAQFVTRSKQNVFYTVPSGHGFLKDDLIRISGASHSHEGVLPYINGQFKISGVTATTIYVVLPVVTNFSSGSFTVSGATITPYGRFADRGDRSPRRARLGPGITDATAVQQIMNIMDQYKFNDYALQRILNTGDTSAIIETSATRNDIDKVMPSDTMRSQLDTVLETFTAIDGKQRRYWVNTSGQLAMQAVDVTAKPAFATAPYKIIVSGLDTPNTVTTAATLTADAIELSYDHQTTKNVVMSIPNNATDTDTIYTRSYLEAGYTARPNAPQFDELLDVPLVSSRWYKDLDAASKTFFLDRRAPILSASFRLTGAGTQSHNNLGWNAGYAFLTLGTMSSASRTGSTVTITMATAHGLASGAEVIIAGITGAAGTSMNGTFTCTVTTTTAFTYTAAGTAGSGTVTAATAFGAKLVSKWEPGQWVDVAAPELGLSGLYRVEQVDFEFFPGSFYQIYTITINRAPTRTMTAFLKTQYARGR
jgi:hypothetical protein